jgi:hypothetical protein
MALSSQALSVPTHNAASKMKPHLFIALICAGAGAGLSPGETLPAWLKCRSFPLSAGGGHLIHSVTITG